ncbi:MAG TPA: DUF5985 family protein [Pirellulales bacterium]|nr:DUF5985 family protein [Pirellulales bacterium]
MKLFIEGMSAMACVVISLFFLRYWKTTSDRLFLIFAIAFILMCITRLVASALSIGQANVDAGSVVHHGYVYTLRFLAYLLILAAIIDKNRPRGAPSG